jgi:hypothetical protein
MALTSVFALYFPIFGHNPTVAAAYTRLSEAMTVHAMRLCLKTYEEKIAREEANRVVEKGNDGLENVKEASPADEPKTKVTTETEDIAGNGQDTLLEKPENKKTDQTTEQNLEDEGSDKETSKEVAGDTVEKSVEGHFE